MPASFDISRNFLRIVLSDTVTTYPSFWGALSRADLSGAIIGIILLDARFFVSAFLTHPDSPFTAVSSTRITLPTRSTLSHFRPNISDCLMLLRASNAAISMSLPAKAFSNAGISSARRNPLSFGITCGSFTATRSPVSSRITDARNSQEFFNVFPLYFRASAFTTRCHFSCVILCMSKRITSWNRFFWILRYPNIVAGDRMFTRAAM